MRKAAAIILIALAAGACDAIVGMFRGASLELRMGGRNAETVWRGEPITVNASLYDPQGFAGAEIEVKGSVERTFSASDFPL